MLWKQIRYGLGVRIAGSHPAGPGSIPGNGIFFQLIHLNILKTEQIKFSSPSWAGDLLNVDVGGVAQMVERSLSMREVLGSIPSASN